MESLPTKDAERGVSFTVADFLEAGRERLGLSLSVDGGGLDRVIAEPTVNRLGLGLTGFFKCFAHRRLQVVGNAERAYLASLSPSERDSRFRAVLDHGARMFVYTGGHKPAAGAVRLVEEYGAVLLQTALATRAFNRDATFVMEELGAPRTSIYGTMVEVCGLGVLFEGDPGLGKSETALGLIKNGAALVADDLTCVRKDVAKNMLFGSASESTAGFMEIRGIGIMHVPRVFGVNAVRGEKRLQLVITFRRMEDIHADIDRIGQKRMYRRILGVDVPNVIIPVSEGRDLVNLVETAAQQQKLISTGYDPVADLSGRLRRRAVPADGTKRRGKRNGK